MGKTALEDLTIRELPVKLQRELLQLVGELEPELKLPGQWLAFYRFVISAYALDQQDRPSVSQLFQALQPLGNSEAARLAVLYAHGLYMLALSDNREIYGEAFNP